MTVVVHTGCPRGETTEIKKPDGNGGLRTIRAERAFVTATPAKPGETITCQYCGQKGTFIPSTDPRFKGEGVMAPHKPKKRGKTCRKN